MEEYIKELKALLEDYDAFFEERMPFSYKKSTRGAALHRRLEALLGTPSPTAQQDTPEVEIVTEQQE